MFTSKKFEITQEEWDNIHVWSKNHNCPIRRHGTIGGGLTISFSPTSIGDIIKVTCDCGAKLTVRELM